MLSCNGSFWRQNAVLAFSRLWKPPRRPYSRCFICVMFEVSNTKRSSKFKFWIQKFEFWAVTARFGAKMLFCTVLHCFSTFSRLRKPPRRPYSTDASYVILEVSNTKRSLKFKFWIQKFEFWAVTVVLAPKCCFALFCTVLLCFSKFSRLWRPPPLQMLHICNIWG